MKRLFPAFLALILGPTLAHAQMRITEWMYQGANGEFIEFTNIGTLSIDMTGWSYDDDSGIPGTINLSAFGTVAPGESVILTDGDAGAFRTAWSLSAGLKIIGGNTAALGRNDTINLYDSSSVLIDSLEYGDEDFDPSIRTQNVSGITTPDVWGTNNVYGWFLSTTTDGFSWTSTGGDIANPGVLAVPEPGTVALVAIGACGVLWRLRRRRAA